MTMPADWGGRSSTLCYRAAMTDLKARIREEATRLGFAECGFTRADLPPETVVELDAWLADGRHGTMAWMEERAAQRASPTAL
jgi:epoxyqueuosine reductase